MPVTLKETARVIAANADQLARTVVGDWGSIIEREPWLALPAVIDQDHLPDLIRCLADCAVGREFDRGACRGLIDTAASHGHSRYILGVDENILFREYHLLRHGIWNHLRDDYGASEEMVPVITRFDAGITLSTRASLHGYHRATHEHTGRWPDVLGTLLDEWMAGRSRDRTAEESGG